MHKDCPWLDKATGDICVLVHMYNVHVHACILHCIHDCTLYNVQVHVHVYTCSLRNAPCDVSRLCVCCSIHSV